MRVFELFLDAGAMGFHAIGHTRCSRYIDKLDCTSFRKHHQQAASGVYVSSFGRLQPASEADGHSVGKKPLKGVFQVDAMDPKCAGRLMRHEERYHAVGGVVLP